MYEMYVWKQGKITTPMETKLLLNYQYQSKNGKKCTKQHLHDVSPSRKLHYMLIKAASSEK